MWMCRGAARRVRGRAASMHAQPCAAACARGAVAAAIAPRLRLERAGHRCWCVTHQVVPRKVQAVGGGQDWQQLQLRALVVEHGDLLCVCVGEREGVTGRDVIRLTCAGRVTCGARIMPVRHISHTLTPTLASHDPPPPPRPGATTHTGTEHKHTGTHTHTHTGTQAHTSGLSGGPNCCRPAL
jgi:hypothetical protein